MINKTLKSLFILLSIFAFTACDDEQVDIVNCQKSVIISKSEFDSTSGSTRGVINSLNIYKNCLTVNFSANGCGGNNWEVKLIDSEEIKEASPVRRRLRFSLTSDDITCTAYLTEELSFDISNLKIDGDEVLLEIVDSKKETNILYQY